MTRLKRMRTGGQFRALFRLMDKACEDILGPFQLIVLDHAHLGDEWFEECIVEEWRGENAAGPVCVAKQIRCVNR